MKRLLLCCAIAFLLTSCTSREDAASALFVQRLSCPAERIQIEEIADTSLHALRQRQTQQKAPSTAPAEIAADPERLALWQEQAEQAQSNQKAIDERYRLYRVSGCQQQEVYACEFMWSQKGLPRGRCSSLAQMLG